MRKYLPIPRSQNRLAYVDPVVVQSDHNKAYFTLEAEELLGTPDELVFFSSSNGSRAVRPAQDADANEMRRKLDPHHTVTVSKRVLAPGHYILKPLTDSLFALVPTPKEKLQRRLTTKTRSSKGYIG